MGEIIAFIIIGAFGCHMMFLLIRKIIKSRFYHHDIYLEGGRYAGDYQGGVYKLVDNKGEDTPTLISSKNSVTSSFSMIYIRLCQMYTGRYYDACLESSLMIGRIPAVGEQSSLILDDPMVSKKHCMLYRRGEQVLIQDLGSKNHTYVNGYPIEGAVLLAHGDRLAFGNSEYQFQCFFQR